MPLGDIVNALARPYFKRAPSRWELLQRAFRAERGNTLDTATRDELRAEVVRGLYLQAPGILLVEIFVTVFIAAVFWNSADRQVLLPWALLLFAANIVRWMMVRRYFAEWRPPEQARAWGRRFAFGAMLTGALWGIAGFGFFDPSDGTLLIVQVFLVIGLSAAALTGYAAHMPSFYAAVLPTVIPFGARLAMDGVPAHLFTATLLAVWVSVFVYLAHTLSGQTHDRIMLLLGNAHMADRLRKARDAADGANRAKTRFLANMSHELRTPLNAILGFSDIMRKEMFGPVGSEKYSRYVADIHKSGAHLLQLINDILDVAKIEVGKQSLDEAVIDVGQCLRECAQLMDPQARKAEVTLSCDVSARLPALRADGTRFRQIVLNLLSNAVKFTPSGGRVTLSAVREFSGGLVVQVRDTGVGMARADIPKALEAFVQLDVKPPRGDTGTGLGLALVKTLVEAHGGTFAIDSEPGRGTVATVRLPKERLAPSSLVTAGEKAA
jgi:two-component system, cell cycle sensor histidine kinase PleC